jgi:hypothetical protein
MTGDMGEQGKFQHRDKIKLQDKWIELFGGLYADHRPDIVWDRLKNKGMYTRNGVRGDLYIDIKPKFPVELTVQEEALLNALKNSPSFCN